MLGFSALSSSCVETILICPLASLGNLSSICLMVERTYPAFLSPLNSFIVAQPPFIGKDFKNMFSIVTYYVYATVFSKRKLLPSHLKSLDQTVFSGFTVYFSRCLYFFIFIVSLISFYIFVSDCLVKSSNLLNLRETDTVDCQRCSPSLCLKSSITPFSLRYLRLSQRVSQYLSRNPILSAGNKTLNLTRWGNRCIDTVVLLVS